MDHLYLDHGVGEISYYAIPDRFYSAWRGWLADDDEGLEPTIVRSMD
jgi:hypothetical protein